MNSQKDSLNELARLYADGKLDYQEYKQKRTLLLKDIIKGKSSIIDTKSVTAETPIQNNDDS